MSYIDTHTHIGPLWYGREPLSPDEMLAWMDQHEIEQIWVMPLESPESSSYYITTEATLANCARHPDRMVPFCVVDARMSMPNPDASFRALIEEYLERGAKGFGEVKIGLPMTDDRLQRLWSICHDLELPVLLHIDGQRCMDDARLSGLEATLQAYPKARFIGHAPGFWGAISGDFRDEDRTAYPAGPVAPGGAVERLLQSYPNLYADISAGSGHTALTRDREFGQGFMERCSDKLLFATDFLMKGQDVPQFQLMTEVELSPGARESISRGNARRLLGV